MNNKRFTFLCTEDEREQLSKLAKYYHRTQSDAIRMLIREALQKILYETKSGAQSLEGLKTGGKHNEQSVIKG